MLRSPLQPMWDLTIHHLSPPPRDSTSLLALIPLSNRYRISQSTPLQGLVSSLALVPLSNRCRSLLQPMWDLTIHPPLWPSVLAGTCSLLQSTWDLTIHPPSGPNFLADTRSPLQSIWDLTIHSPLRPSVLTGTRSLSNRCCSPFKSMLSPFPIDVGSHNPPPIHPPSGPVSSLALGSPFQSMCDLTIQPLQG